MKQTDHFLSDDFKKQEGRLGYLEGFRFGLGFFVAWALGSMVLFLLGVLLSRVLHWL